MLLKINTTINLSTGESVSGAVVNTFNDMFRIAIKEFTFDMYVWRSLADKTANMDPCYFYNTEKIYKGNYVIPQGDLDQSLIDGHFGLIGTNHPLRMKEAFASMLNIDASDVEILSLA